MGKSKKFGRKSAKSEPPQAQQEAPESEAPTMQGAGATEPAVTTRKPKKDAAPKGPREERNGVKRPSPGKCLDVWEYLDRYGDMKSIDLKPVAAEKSWNQNNSLIELYRWRKFNGIVRSESK